MYDEELSRLRTALAGERSPAFRKTLLLEEFDRLHARPPCISRWRAWIGAAAAAAALAAAALSIVWTQPPPAESPLLAGEFIDVPYSQPAGPWSWVVRTELDGAALARMGLDIPAAYGATVEAEIVLGEDGMPSAVRLIKYVELQTS